jgi:hypothetical protein
MIATELGIGRVPEDFASPAPTGGCVMACVAFYDQGFGVPSH